MLFKGLDKLKRSTIMSAVILMFIGNMLLVIPETYFPFLSSSLAFALLVLAVMQILNYISTSPKTLMSYIYLSLGLFAGLIGIMLFVFDDMFLILLSWLVSIIPILFGIYGIYHAFAFARRSGRKGWWILIILSGLLMVFGGFILFNPWMDSTQAMIQVIGGSLMYSAFVSILRLIWVWPIRN